MRVLWAHGLEGSPNGSKPTWISDNLGWDVLCPAMSENGWTIADQTEVIAKAIAENEDIDVIMGSIITTRISIAGAIPGPPGSELKKGIHPNL